MEQTKKEPSGSFFYFGRAGFTLMELVTILVIVSILAVAAAPRFWNSTFDQAKLYEQTLAALRYAQRTAVAHQRTVCVYVTATTLTLRYRATRGDNACNPGTDAALPAPGGDGGSPYVVTAPSGVTLGFTSANFYFDLLGSPSAAQTITVSGGSTIAVEATSGYVH